MLILENAIKEKPPDENNLITAFLRQVIPEANAAKCSGSRQVATVFANS